MRTRIGHGAQLVPTVARSLRPTAELFRTSISAVAADRLTDRSRRLICQFHEAAMTPYQKGISTFLEGDRAARGNIILGEGVEGFFRTLDPLVTWRSPTLEIAGSSDQTIHLEGRGLLITPSLFFYDQPEVFVPGGDGEGAPVLVYSPPLTVETSRRLWSLEAPGERWLAALLGRTRGKLLQVLVSSFTTTELSNRLGVSAASISQHTGVLRDAGLITSRRKQNTVRHTLTPLGLALVHQYRLGGQPRDENPAVTADHARLLRVS
ncbi:ArsR/SmtB family transcription factor [Micromonospora echinospora]|uniref:ArsR/SmtB family transcription factor n=1 Tax=Micromonospora echinospora TaxID=1877 RepID=UPI003CE74603